MFAVSDGNGMFWFLAILALFLMGMKRVSGLGGGKAASTLFRMFNRRR